MKKTILFILTMTLFSSIYAQFYNLTNENIIWRNLEVACLPTGNVYSTKDLRFKGDTVVDGIAYKILEQTSSFGWVLSGFYRCDSVQGKTWFKLPFMDNEGLIYDFSAKQGDTIRIVNQTITTDTLHLVVQQRDSVSWGSAWRIRLTLKGTETLDTEQWIDGVGNLRGLGYSGSSIFPALCGNEELLCFHENGELVWLNPLYSDCSPMLSTDEHDSNQLSWTYNRQNNTLIVYNLPGSNEKLTMTIFTINGQTIGEFDLKTPQTSVTLSGISNEIVIVSIFRNGKRIKGFKIVK